MCSIFDMSRGRLQLFVLLTLGWGIGVGLSGCVSRYPQAAMRVRDGRSDGILLEPLPCVRQTRYQCGPAALEMVMGYWGREIDSDSVAAQVFDVEDRTTTVQAMAAFEPPPGYWVSAGYHDGPGLLARLESGMPIIVLLERSRPNFQGGHYHVVHGVDRTRKLLFMSSGAGCDRLMSWPLFEYLWERTGHWLMVICPLDVPTDTWPMTAGEYVDRGWHLERNERWAEAEISYQRALTINPAFVQARVNAGNLMMGQGRWSEAEALFREGLTLRPEEPRMRNNLAWTLGMLDRVSDGLALAEDLVREQGGTEHARLEYLDTWAWLLVRVGRGEEGRAILDQALERARAEEASVPILEGLERHYREAVHGE